MAKAVEALARKRVKRIILARPAVEAGESLGFLPGDLQAKVDPYLRPLYDALEDMMPHDRVQRALETRTIEIAPLAYMRGRTLADAFIILDEAQNATGAQMKMFLTRRCCWPDQSGLAPPSSPPSPPEYCRQLQGISEAASGCAGNSPRPCACIGAIQRVSREQEHRQRLLGRQRDLEQLAAEQGIIDDGVTKSHGSARRPSPRHTAAHHHGRAHAHATAATGSACPSSA